MDTPDSTGVDALTYMERDRNCDGMLRVRCFHLDLQGCALDPLPPGRPVVKSFSGLPLGKSTLNHHCRGYGGCI